MRPEDIGWSEDALGNATDPVTVRWLGTASFSLEYAGFVLLIDPYITRARLRDCVLRPLRSDLTAIGRWAPKADGIVAGHTHFDHVLDVPAIAAQTGSIVFGSRSCASLCRSAGIPERRIQDMERGPGEPSAIAEVGPFRLTFHPSRHSAFLLGRVPFPGEIVDCDQVSLRTEAYRCGAVFALEVEVAGRRIVHLGSADLVDSTLRTDNVDLLLQCVAGWRSSPDLPERVVRAVQPRAVLLSHWDNFFASLDRPARLLPAIGFSEMADRLMRSSRDLVVGTLPIHGQVRV